MTDQPFVKFNGRYDPNNTSAVDAWMEDVDETAPIVPSKPPAEWALTLRHLGKVR
jgi:hypothetical protein